MKERVRACIRPDALRHNFAEVRRLAPASRVMSVVKADGYGHGLCEVASWLPESDAFAVATLDEGVALRAAGISRPIVLLSGFFEARQVEVLLARRIDPVIHHDYQVGLLAAAGAGSARVDVWLKVDSGMHRLGFAPAAVAAALARLRALPVVAELRWMSHFAAADEHDSALTRAQLGACEVLRDLSCEYSLANSAGVAAWPQSHADWVRPGLMLYGASPLSYKSARRLRLQAAMSLRSVLVSVRRVRKGEGVGYGPLWRCPEDMPVGIVACGYGDGYPRMTANEAPVWIDGYASRVIGAVSMDSLAVDLRPAPHLKPGAVVELWGERVPVNKVAEAARSVPHQLLCGVGKRVPRVVASDG